MTGSCAVMLAQLFHVKRRRGRCRMGALRPRPEAPCLERRKGAGIVNAGLSHKVIHRYIHRDVHYFVHSRSGAGGPGSLTARAARHG